MVETLKILNAGLIFISNGMCVFLGVDSNCENISSINNISDINNNSDVNCVNDDLQTKRKTGQIPKDIKLIARLMRESKPILFAKWPEFAGFYRECSQEPDSLLAEYPEELVAAIKTHENSIWTFFGQNLKTFHVCGKYVSTSIFFFKIFVKYSVLPVDIDLMVTAYKWVEISEMRKLSPSPETTEKCKKILTGFIHEWAKYTEEEGLISKEVKIAGILKNIRDENVSISLSSLVNPHVDTVRPPRPRRAIFNY